MCNIIKPLTDEQRQERKTQTEELKKAVEEYSKYNYFLGSLASQIKSGRELTQNQIDAAKAVIDRITLRRLESQQEAVGVPATKSDSKFKVGDILTVNQTVAMKIGIQAGFAKKFHNIEILEVMDETYGSITIKAVTCYKKVSHCGICGLTLTDPESIAKGIGPVCGRRTGVMNVEDLNQALGKAEITIRIPKPAIKSIFSKGE